MLRNMRQALCKILEKDDKMTVEIFVLYFFRTQVNKTLCTSYKVYKDIYWLRRVLVFL